MKMPDNTFRHRRQSFDIPGHAHELTFSCRKWIKLLSKDRTRMWLVEALDLARARHDLYLWAYAIMPEHAHVLLISRRDDYKVARILKTIKQPVARKAIARLRACAPDWLERLAGHHTSKDTTYHFWEPGGGYDRNIITTKAAHAVVEYIHNNPVRRGLVDSPEQWPWSSAGWYAGQQDVKLEMDPTLPEMGRSSSLRSGLGQQ